MTEQISIGRASPPADATSGAFHQQDPGMEPCLHICSISGLKCKYWSDHHLHISPETPLFNIYSLDDLICDNSLTRYSSPLEDNQSGLRRQFSLGEKKKKTHRLNPATNCRTQYQMHAALVMNLELTSYSNLSVQLRGYNHCTFRTVEGRLRSNSEDYCSEQKWTDRPS